VSSDMDVQLVIRPET